jgi:hypothetical protein
MTPEWGMSSYCAAASGSMNFAAIVGFCSIWAMPFLRNNLQRHKRNQSAGDPLIEGETLFRVGHPPL